MATPKMQFSLKGFSQDMGFRVFAFEGIAADRSRLAFSVRTDLALTRRYGIRLQELPLLCHGLLESCEDLDGQREFTYAEADMCQYANREAARAEAAKQRKAPRRPVAEQPAPAWQQPTRWPE
jgi:hypothetical protein